MRKNHIVPNRQDPSALEMNEIGEAVNPILYAFRSDDDRTVTVTAYKPEIPIEIIEHFVVRVREELIEK